MTGLSVALVGGEFKIACATGETNIWLSPSAKQRRNPCSGSPPVYQDLSTRHDWPVKKDMLDLPIRMKGNSKRIFGDSLSPLEAQNKYLGAASQTLLTEVKLRLRRRLPLQRLRNEKVMEAKIRPAIISWIVTRDAPFSCWPTCYMSMILATVPEVKMKK